MKNNTQGESCYVYLLLCKNQSLYCGWTTNLERRFHQHQLGKGARYTRIYKPICIYCYFKVEDARTARRLDYAIKQLTHKEKLSLNTMSQEEVIQWLL